jgi:hypothetical protein
VVKYGVMSFTTGRVRVGTQTAASLHRRSMAKDVTGMTETCATSSAVEMHVAGSITGAKSLSAMSSNDMMRGTMIIMVLPMTNLTDSAPRMSGTTHKESRPFPTT